MRNPHRARELQTIATQEALPIVILPLDVDDDGSVQGAVAHVLAERGRIDVLVNNAGITPLGPIEERPLTEFRQTMETNFFGAVCGASRRSYPICVSSGADVSAMSRRWRVALRRRPRGRTRPQSSRSRR